MNLGEPLGYGLLKRIFRLRITPNNSNIQRLQQVCVVEEHRSGQCVPGFAFV
jgi:hypothetical protein